MPEQRFSKNFKTKRRIMRSFKMSEISGVDRPAQEGARVVISKRAPDDAETFAKAAFSEILAQREHEKDVCEAFYEAFEDQWTANDALRTALTDAFADGEQSVREYVAKIEEMAFGALDAIREKSASDNMGKALYFSAVAEASASFTKKAEATMYKTLAALKAAIKKFTDEGGDAAEIKTIQKSAIDLDATDQLSGDLALAAPAPKDDPEVATLKREVAVLKLAGDARTYFDGLDAAAQDAFLAKSAADQRADVDAANADDPVVHKCADGTEIRKSDGPAVLAMAKRADKLEADLAKATAQNEDAAFEKQATTEFKYLPTEGTVEMLKAAAAMPEDKKKKMLDAMRASNAAAAKNFKPHGSIGKSAPDDADGDSAEDKLDAMAKAYAAENSGMTFAKAYDHVLTTPEGSALYREVVSGVPAGEED